MFSDLDAQVQLELPADLDAAATFAVIDDLRQLLVLYAEGQPAKVYPTVDDGLELRVDAFRVGLRPGDQRELEPLLRQPGQLRRLAAEATPAPGDATQPDARKLPANMIFSGWMFASSPALNGLEHPVYDVWVIDC